MVEYGRREETACGLPIILGCKLISGHERFQIPFDLRRKPQTEGSHLRNELDAQGRGQIHLCLLSSGFLIVLYLIPSFTYLQDTKGEGGDEWGGDHKGQYISKKENEKGRLGNGRRGAMNCAHLGSRCIPQGAMNCAPPPTRFSHLFLLIALL